MSNCCGDYQCFACRKERELREKIKLFKTKLFFKNLDLSISKFEALPKDVQEKMFEAYEESEKRMKELTKASTEKEEFLKHIQDSKTVVESWTQWKQDIMRPNSKKV